MAKVMNFESADGTAHAESYWMVAFVSLDKLATMGFVTLHGYHDKDARDAQKQPIGKLQYAVDSTQYATLFSPAALSVEEMNPYRAAYLVPDAITFFAGAIDA